MPIFQTTKQQISRHYAGGLIDLTPDGTEYSLQELGAKEIGKAPEKEFEVPNRPPLKDQGNSDFCVAFQGSYTVEQDFGNTLSAAFLFAATKRRYYSNYLGFGLSIKSALSTLQKDGICKDELYPFTNNRNKMANYKNIPAIAWADAETRKMKKGYFVVDIFKNKFDNVLAGMYNWREPVITGLTWYSGYKVDDKNRLVMRKTGNKVGHAVGSYKSVMVDGEQRVEFQNSYSRMPKFSLNKTQCNELYFGYIVLPIERPIIEILKKYSGKLIRAKSGRPPIYLVQNGQKRHFPNENMLNMYGFTLNEHTEVPDEDIAVIPEGEKMTEKDLQPPMVELLKRNNLKVA